MHRRTLLASTSMATLGLVVQGLGELTELALPTSQPLPLRLGMVHVHAVEAVTERLRGVARQFGGQADLFGAAAKLYARWLSVPASEVVKVRLRAALAELYTEAGWAYYDAGVDGMGCFTRALADEAGDGFGIANAAWQAGATLVRSGHPNDALKCFQLGQFSLRGFQPGKATPAILRAGDSRIPTLTAWLSLNSATAYALMDHPEQAKRCLAAAREGGRPVMRSSVRLQIVQPQRFSWTCGGSISRNRSPRARCAPTTRAAAGVGRGPNSSSPRCTCGPGSLAG